MSTTQTMARPATATGNSQPESLPQAMEFLSALFQPHDHILFRPIEAWIEDGRKKAKVDYKGIRYATAGPNGDTVLPAILKLQAERAKASKCNIFFGVCPRFGGSKQYDLAWQIRVVRVLWADVDDCRPDEAIERCEAAGLPRPSIIVSSGNGAHLYWLLAEPYLIDDVDDPLPVKTDWIDKRPHRYLIDPATKEKLSLDAKQNVPDLSAKAQRIQDIIAGIASKIGGDATQDLSRLLRVPGTLNRKGERNGREPVPCVLVECDPTRRYPIEEFEQFVDASPAKTKREQLAKVKLPAPRKLSPGRRDAFNELLTTCAVAPVGQRSDADWSLVCYAIEHGQSRAETWAQVQGVGKFAEGGSRYFSRTWEKAEVHTREKIFERVQKKAETSAARKERAGDGVTPEQAAEWVKNPSGPQILVGFDEARVADEAIQVITKEPNLYQRGGKLVQVLSDTKPPRGIVRPAGAPRIAILRQARLREIMAAHAKWAQSTDDGYVPCHVPRWAVEAVAAREQWEGIRPIEGVVESPVLRADGTVLQTAGYDASTGLLFQPRGAFPEIPERLTIDDARRAAEALLEPVADFPFATPAHRSAWLTATLTPFSRFAFYGCAPLNLIDANVRGCGKGLLADVTGATFSWRGMARMAKAGDDAESRKRITALAIAGDPLILIDNIAGFLGSPSLDAALTATSWSDRVLGKSEMVRDVPLTATWYATANNAVLGADTARRVLHIRLESPEEKPEERSGFRHPKLLDWVQHEQPRLAAAAVSTLAAYCQAGRPDMKLRPWGSFEAWSDLVRQAVVWTGLPDPAETRGELNDQADVEGNALRLLVDALEEEDPGRDGLTAAEILKLIDHDKDDLHAALRNAITELVFVKGGGLPSTRSLGMKLHHLRRRVVNERWIDKRPTNRGALWSVHGGEKRGTKETKGTNLPLRATRKNNTSQAQEIEEGSSSPFSPFSVTDCDHTDVAETPTHDGYLNRTCRACGENLGCQKLEATP